MAPEGKKDETEPLNPSSAENPQQSPGSFRENAYAGLTLKNRYLLEKEIGRGGFGAVYLARDQQLLSKLVVVKILLQRQEFDAWSRRKFHQEIEALARIDHPGVVGVLDSGEMPDGKPFLVMQFVEGVNLRSIMKPEGMDLERVAYIIRQVGSALSAAHDKGVWHRDLKPENIMLQRLGDDEEHVKLIDFGVAKVSGSQSPGSTPESLIAGSLDYMAPEQLMGAPKPLSDIYAMGVIAYEMVTGRTPFHSSSPAQLHAMQRVGVRVKPADLRPELSEAAQEIILRALSFDPNDRPGRAWDFGKDLAHALTGTVELDSFPSDRGASSALEMAHIISIEIIEHRHMPFDQQVRSLKGLQEIVRDASEVRRNRGTDRLIHLVTPEGILLVFFRNPMSPVQVALELLRAVQSRPEIKLRMGLHTGPVYRISDSGSGRHVAGDGIITAQRVMVCGDAGHILLSEAVADMLRQLSTWPEHLHDIGHYEVNPGQRVHLFNLYTPELGNRAIPERLRARVHSDEARIRREPNLGQLVSKLCDRRAQEDEFKNCFLSNFEQRPGIPQIYVIHGGEGECHESLVERFIYELQTFATERYGAEKGTVSLRKIPWQYEGATGLRKARLLSRVFESCAPTRNLRVQDLSPAGFGKLVGPSLNSFLLIQHDIRAARWDRSNRELIEAYLQFWADVNAGTTAPQILIFLNIVYAPIQRSDWRDWLQPELFRNQFTKNRILRELGDIKNPGCPFLILSELRPITRDDVLEWFSLHNIYDSEEPRLRASMEMFTSGRRHSLHKKMAEIEVDLRAIHNQFLANRGY